jgi:hypothetical protein
MLPQATLDVLKPEEIINFIAWNLDAGSRCKKLDSRY